MQITLKRVSQRARALLAVAYHSPTRIVAVKTIDSWLPLCVCLLFAGCVLGQEAAQADGSAHGGQTRVAPGPGLRQLPFIENVGQIDGQVRYYASVPSGTVFVTDGGEMVYSLARLDTGQRTEECSVTARLLGATRAKLAAQHHSPIKVSDFRSSDPRRWRHNLPTWGSVEMGEVYPGINLELRARSGSVEQVFHVQPGGHPEQIRVGLQGAAGLRADAEGRLEVLTDAGRILFTRPAAYQVMERDTVFIEVAYAAGGDSYGFSVGAYDCSQPLIIDPLLAATYLGGSGEDGYRDVPVIEEPDGTVLVAGSTRSADFPSTAGTYDGTHNGGCDVFIARFDSQLSTLLAATFFGTGGDDGAWPGVNMAEDGLGHIYVTGTTTSTALPTTTGAYDRTYNGSGDVFVASFSNGLDTLLACTYLGGSATDDDAHLVLGGGDDLFVTGYTASSNFPTTPGAFDRTRTGPTDAFAARLSRDLTTLMASTFLGGNGDEFAPGSLWDPSGYLYVAGITNTVGFPTTPGAYDRQVNVNPMEVDVFLSKFSADLSTLVASTFIGGSNTDFPYALGLGTTGDIFVAGHVQSTDYPTTPSAYDRTYNSPPGDYDDTFVSRLSPDLSQLIASTYLGGSDWDWAITMICDGSGQVFIGGETRSPNLPTTPGAFSETPHGGTSIREGFISRFDESLTTLQASTYLGGSGDDLVSRILMDSSGNILATGGTGSSDFPMSAAGYDTTFNGGENRWGGDVFVIRLDGLLTSSTGSVDDRDQGRVVPLLEVTPNPVGATASIRFALTRRSQVRVAVYDVQGQRVSTLAEGRKGPGEYSLAWDGRDEAGREVGPGIYFLRVIAGDDRADAKVIMLK